MASAASKTSTYEIYLNPAALGSSEPVVKTVEGVARMEIDTNNKVNLYGADDKLIATFQNVMSASPA